MKIGIVVEAKAELDETVDEYRIHASDAIAKGFIVDFEHAV